MLRLIRGEPLGPAIGPCDIDELSRLATEHMIISPLASSVAEEEGIDPRWRRWAAAVSLASERDARLRGEATEKTIGLLASEGIPAILLKGPSLALGRPRDSGDVDLLIPDDRLTKAISLLEAAGFEYRGFARNMHIRRSEYRDWKRLSRWSVQFEFSEPGTGTLVELHIAFFETARVYSEDLSTLRAAVGEFAASSVVDEVTGYRFLALEDRALLLALQAGLKRSPENQNFVLRHVLDMRALVDEGIDWEKLEQRAFRFGIAHHLLFLLLLCESLAGACSPPGYVERLESRLPRRLVRLTSLHLNCLRGPNAYDRAAIFAYRFAVPFLLHGSALMRLRSLLVLPILLPPPYRLVEIYGLRPRSPLAYFCYALEPARCIYRLIRKASRMLKAP